MKRKTKRVSKPRKKWVNSNKPTHNGITFDSDQELLMYKLLKTAGIGFKYIGKDKGKYNLQETFTYSGQCYERLQKRSKELKNRQKVLGVNYTPDFVGDSERWFIEVKGRKLGDFSLRWKMFKQSLENKDFQPMLFMPVTKEDCKQVIEILKENGYGTEES